MERRYSLLSEAQVRDITGYNRKLPELEKAWEHEKHLALLAAEEAATVAATTSRTTCPTSRRGCPTSSSSSTSSRTS
jgi:hypothetical protein